MLDGAHAIKTIPSDGAAPAAGGGISLLWPALAGLSGTLAAGAVGARLVFGAQYDGLLVTAAGAAGAVLALRLLYRWPAARQGAAAQMPDPLKELFDSAGPAIVAIALDGRLTYVNPAAERMIGYHADELMREWVTVEILGPGEGVRLVAEMEKICGVERPMPSTPSGRMAAYMEWLRDHEV